MNYKDIEDLIGNSFDEVPEMILQNIKKKLAIDVALQLIEQLEGQKKSKNRESIDRINEETYMFLKQNNLLERGA